MPDDLKKSVRGRKARRMLMKQQMAENVQDRSEDEFADDTKKDRKALRQARRKKNNTDADMLHTGNHPTAQKLTPDFFHRDHSPSINKVVPAPNDGNTAH